MAGGWVHRIDPILGSIGGLHVWWYGLGFALGFWTQDVPDRYSARHPGLHHSWVYPDIDTVPRKH
jgi:hypothetical protein